MRQIKINSLAKTANGKFKDFKPHKVIFIKRGGRVLGEKISHNFKVPCIGIEICYPMTNYLKKLPKFFEIIFWPVKEFFYRITQPVLSKKNNLLLENNLKKTNRIILVDDSASSGKTLLFAIDLLQSFGIQKKDIKVVVGRAGKRAKNLVDFTL